MEGENDYWMRWSSILFRITEFKKRKNNLFYFAPEDLSALGVQKLYVLPVHICKGKFR